MPRNRGRRMPRESSNSKWIVLVTWLNCILSFASVCSWVCNLHAGTPGWGLEHGAQLTSSKHIWISFCLQWLSICASQREWAQLKCHWSQQCTLFTIFSIHHYVACWMDTETNVINIGMKCLHFACLGKHHMPLLPAAAQLFEHLHIAVNLCSISSRVMCSRTVLLALFSNNVVVNVLRAPLSIRYDHWVKWKEE